MLRRETINEYSITSRGQTAVGLWVPSVQDRSADSIYLAALLYLVGSLFLLL